MVSLLGPQLRLTQLSVLTSPSPPPPHSWPDPSLAALCPPADTLLSTERGHISTVCLGHGPKLAFLSSPGSPNKTLSFLHPSLTGLFSPVSQPPTASLLLPLYWCFPRVCFIFLLDGKSLWQSLWLSRLRIPTAPGRWDGWGWSPWALTGLHWPSVCPTSVLRSRHTGCWPSLWTDVPSLCLPLSHFLSGSLPE